MVLLKTVIVYAVTFLIVLPLLCHNLPFSSYFAATLDESHNKAVAINKERIKIAEDYLASLPRNVHGSGSVPKPGSLQIAIGVVTVSRQTKTFSTQYLTQVMARLHETVTRLGVGDRVFMFICNVQKMGKPHNEADYLAQYFHMVRFLSSRSTNEHRIFDMEKEHYIFCLESAAKFDAKYVLIVEDDTLPHSDFYEVLDYLLESRLERTISLGMDMPGNSDWGWLKLNFPESLGNFHRSPYFALEWVALTLTCSALVSLIAYLRMGRISEVENYSAFERDRRHQRHCIVLYAVFVLSFIYFFLAFWLVGRPYFLQLYGLSKYFTRLDPGTSCCTPALLFPREQIPGLVSYLRGVKCSWGFPLDFALDAYRQQTKLRQYLAVPNLFCHIGYYSALHSSSNKIAAYSYLDTCT